MNMRTWFALVLAGVAGAYLLAGSMQFKETTASRLYNEAHARACQTQHHN